jgi:hypothetical protein
VILYGLVVDTSVWEKHIVSNFDIFTAVRNLNLTRYSLLYHARVEDTIEELEMNPAENKLAQLKKLVISR